MRIGLLGRGTVGGAFEKLVSERTGMVEALSGRKPEISGTVTRKQGEFEAVLGSSDVLVELIGGIDPARDWVTRALRSGVHVVTANKQLVAQYGDELLAAARDGGAQLRFEAAVAGAIPVIRVIQESLAAIEIERVSGIVNGTTNFILSEMTRTGASYEHALAQAKGAGYAEADPTEDVSGADAAAKMAIIARLAFGTAVSLEQVPYEGIEQVHPDDIAYAKELGLSLKLLGVAERSGNGISVRVFPCFLFSGHPLSHVDGAFNAVTVEAPQITEITMSGPGAGGPETASAVLGDVVSVITGGAPLPEDTAELPLVAEASSAFYLHLEVEDKPGVLARIADVLGRNEVSVRSVVQQGMGEDARLAMVMHEGPESRFAQALDEIRKLDFLRSTPRAIRVIEEEFK